MSLASIWLLAAATSWKSTTAAGAPSSDPPAAARRVASGRGRAKLVQLTGAVASDGEKSARELENVGAVACLHQGIAAEYLFCLGERAVRHVELASLGAHAQRRAVSVDTLGGDQPTRFHPFLDQGSHPCHHVGARRGARGRRVRENADESHGQYLLVTLRRTSHTGIDTARRKIDRARRFPRTLQIPLGINKALSQNGSAATSRRARALARAHSPAASAAELETVTPDQACFRPRSPHPST